MTPSFTDPPVPHFPFNSFAIFLRNDLPGGNPQTVVTVFPLRPFTSRRMRTMSSVTISAAFDGCFFLQVQNLAGCRQLGQIRPLSVEYTRQEFFIYRFRFVENMRRRDLRWLGYIELHLPGQFVNYSGRKMKTLKQHVSPAADEKNNEIRQTRDLARF